MPYPYRQNFRRCPCCCGGEGYLLFLTCSHCGHVVVACDEVGSVFADPRELSIRWPDWLDYGGRVQTPCPGCKIGLMQDYRCALESEILALGFRRTELDLHEQPFED